PAQALGRAAQRGGPAGPGARPGLNGFPDAERAVVPIIAGLPWPATRSEESAPPPWSVPGGPARGAEGAGLDQGRGLDGGAGVAGRQGGRAGPAGERDPVDADGAVVVGGDGGRLRYAVAGEGDRQVRGEALAGDRDDPAGRGDRRVDLQGRVGRPGRGGAGAV